MRLHAACSLSELPQPHGWRIWKPSAPTAIFWLQVNKAAGAALKRLLLQLVQQTKCQVSSAHAAVMSDLSDEQGDQNSEWCSTQQGQLMNLKLIILLTM